MTLSRYGKIVQKWWEEIPAHFPDVETGAFIVMPNHVHGIIFIVERRGTVPVPKEYGVNETSNNNNMSCEIQGGETPPYAHRHWDRLSLISNINQQKK
jgi:hypothetical protein